MATAQAMEWVQQWAEQLADLAVDIENKLPEKDDWDIIRHFLRNVSGLLRKGKLRAGYYVIIRVLPHVQRALFSIEGCSNAQNSFDVTDMISQHFLVGHEAKSNVVNLMKISQAEMSLLRDKVEEFSEMLNMVLDDTLLNGKPLSLWMTLKLAFQMNRISALLRSCADHLQQARGQLDDLDTMVASKALMARVFTMVCFFMGLLFTSSGNVPVGAACWTAASAGRKSTKSLDEYRRDLRQIDSSHVLLQAELDTWNHRFTAERRNFFLVVCVQRNVCLLLLLVTMVTLGRLEVQLAVFAVCFVYFYVRAEETRCWAYAWPVLLGPVALLAQFFYHSGLAMYNAAIGSLLLAEVIGLVDL